MQQGGEIASAAVVADRLSSLPEDVLVLILLRLDDAVAAARTGVLSRRWRRIWRLLPELRFPGDPAAHSLRAVLEGHEAPLRLLLVWTRFAAASSVAAWLPAAARRVSGHLNFGNIAVQRSEDEPAQGAAFALPCFERATSISLHLGFLGLAAPAAGVFARLRELNLRRVRFHGPWGLADAFSSPRFPCLQKLSICDARGMDNLTLHSECLLTIQLNCLQGLQQLTIVASALRCLRIEYCSDSQLPAANISAPQLKLLGMDVYDPSSVYLGNTEHLEWMGTFFFLVYGQFGSPHNQACLRLLQKVVGELTLSLVYPHEIHSYHYLMDDMTLLPGVTSLDLIVMANGHAFGASSFHVLRMCSGIRRLIVALRGPTEFEAYTCPSGCICAQQPNWEVEELQLNHLEEVEITEFIGSEQQVPFVKRLFNWATVLKKISVTFDVSVAEKMAKELYQMLQSFSRPEICMEFYWYLDGSKVLYAPKD
ncbi:hypothetical protein ACP70R_015156 [Stipagrostis hirtigluma subsp. patula]